MHLGLSPSRIHAAVVVAQLVVHPPPEAHAAWYPSRSGVSAGRSRKTWRVDLTTGVVPVILQRGLTSSVGLRRPPFLVNSVVVVIVVVFRGRKGGKEGLEGKRRGRRKRRRERIPLLFLSRRKRRRERENIIPHRSRRTGPPSRRCTRTWGRSPPRTDPPKRSPRPRSTAARQTLLSATPRCRARQRATAQLQSAATSESSRTCRRRCRTTRRWRRGPRGTCRIKPSR